jgi:hypothetical protein
VRQPERRDVSVKAALVECSRHDGTSAARLSASRQAKTVPSRKTQQLQPCAVRGHHREARVVKHADDRVAAAPSMQSATVPA